MNNNGVEERNTDEKDREIQNEIIVYNTIFEKFHKIMMWYFVKYPNTLDLILK